MALLVLESQTLRKPRYTHVRHGLKDHGYDFAGVNPETRVKDLISRARIAGFLEGGAGGNLRRAGERPTGLTAYRIGPGFEIEVLTRGKGA